MIPEVKLEVGKKYLCYKKFSPTDNTLEVYGEGTYLGVKHVNTEEGKFTTSVYDCFGLDTGEFFISKLHPGGFGTKETILGNYEGMGITQKRVKVPAPLILDLLPANKSTSISVKARKTKKMSLSLNQPLVVFAVSSDRRVTICGRIVEVKNNNKEFVFALGISKQRKGDLLLRKRGNKIARERATKKPYEMRAIEFTSDSPITAHDVVKQFKEMYTKEAEFFSRNPLSKNITQIYKMKSVETSRKQQ